LQTLPHVPQFDAFVMVFTHALLQNACPLGHEHVEFAHERPPLQTMPHAPQWFASVAVFTHAPLQAMVPDAQVDAQRPIEHTWPVAHTVLHAPQFIGFV
jgi:hypothetical protein